MGKLRPDLQHGRPYQFGNPALNTLGSGILITFVKLQKLDDATICEASTAGIYIAAVG
jgi:hypothetical protein